MKPIPGVKVICKTPIPRQDRVVHHHPLLGWLRLIWISYQHKLPLEMRWKWKGKN